MIKMRTCEKGVAVGVVVAIVVVAAAAAVGGYLVLNRGETSNAGGGGDETATTSGTGATVTTGGTAMNSKFDFSTESTVSGDTYDFAIEPWQNWYDENGLTPAVQGYNGIDNLIKDMGAVDLASVAAAPGSGYSADALAATGHVYVIKCQDENYAKIRITSITYTDGENYPATITFDWVYQPDGSMNF